MKNVNWYLVVGFFLLATGPIVSHFVGGTSGVGIEMAGGFCLGIGLRRS